MSRRAEWKSPSILRLACLAVLFVAPTPTLQAQRADSASVVAALSRGLRTHDLTLAVYERRGFEPIWTNAEAVESLLRGIAAMGDDGLDPERYRFSALRAAGGDPLDAAHQAELDILRTDALVRAGHDLRYGMVEPAWTLAARERQRPEGDGDAVAEIFRVVRSAKVREALADLRPRRTAYTTLMQALADLRVIEASGGWGTIPSGSPLRPGEEDERVPMLRRRLALEGDLRAPADETSWLYDAPLEAAVRTFQHRRGLQESGVVQESTLAALNVPVGTLIDRVRVNLERLRWVGHELPDTFVEVNVAAARLQLVSGDRVIFAARTIVGTDATPTPVFAANILHVTLNPTWTVPPGIVGEVLAAIRKDPGYLRGQGMRLFDAGGREVDPDGIDFSRYTGRDFPYRIRQDAGPSNALGRLKLEMPNGHHVYLHDTPARDLFGRERRLFSHGCVRIEDPLGLAEHLLRAPEAWNRVTLDAAIATGVTKSLPLPSPVPVLLLYWTATAGPDGRPHYYADVYGHDAKVLAALEAGLSDGTR